MARDVRKARWSRHAVRLVSYVNFRWSLATIGPRLGLTGLLLSLLLVLGRRAAVETLTLALAAIAVFVSVLLVSQARLWRTRYRLRDAWSRLDHDLRMHGALLSAVEGVTPWPKLPERGVRLKADTHRARTGLGAALSGAAVVVAAFLVPISVAPAKPKPPVAPPPSFEQIEEGLAVLEEEPLLEPEMQQRWEEQLEALESLPAEEWYAHETQEAADTLREEMNETLARADRALAPAQRAAEALASMDEATRRKANAGDSAWQRELQKVMERNGSDRRLLDPELAKQLNQLDGESAEGLTDEQLEELSQRLARARAQAKEARGEGDGEGEGASENGRPGEKPGKGGVQRGPGTAPIRLTAEASRRRSDRIEGLETPLDLERDALSDVIQRDALPPEVDTSASFGPRASKGAVAGRGGEAVWTDRLLPEEQVILQKYFE